MRERYTTHRAVAVVLAVAARRVALLLVLVVSAIIVLTTATATPTKPTTATSTTTTSTTPTSTTPLRCSGLHHLEIARVGESRRDYEAMKRVRSIARSLFACGSKRDRTPQPNFRRRGIRTRLPPQYRAHARALFFESVKNAGFRRTENTNPGHSGLAAHTRYKRDSGAANKKRCGRSFSPALLLSSPRRCCAKQLPRLCPVVSPRRRVVLTRLDRG